MSDPKSTGSFPANAASRRMYTNTVAFALFSGVVSGVLLLVLMLAPESIKGYTVLMVTVQVGLLFVVGWALVAILLQQRRARRDQEYALDNKLAVLTCPDYWTLQDDSMGGTKGVCVNRYVAPPSVGQRVGDKIIFSATQSTNQTVELAAVNGKSLPDACAVADRLNAPWTDLRAMCDSYNGTSVD